ncbi:MAG: helix-turn-helix domain-containing protein [Patescibacteria group bacterium]
MDIRNILEALGLNKKQVDIYLTCLEHGPETITNISKLSGHKRSTIYNVIEDLLRGGFLVLIRRNKHTLYDAEKPKRLLTIIRARERELEQLLPQLETIRNTKKEIPNIQILESEVSVKNLYDEVYSSFNNKDEVCFLSAVGDLFKNLPLVMDAYFAKFHNRKDYKIRELILNDEEGRRYVRLLRHKGISHPVKLLPTDFPIFNDLVIYENKVLIASFKNRVIVTLFDNPEIFLTLKTLFEWAWQNGKLV